jgi:adenylyltransferase/sulfurtransferase
VLEFERTSQAVIQELQKRYDVQCDAKQPKTIREISAAELRTLLQQPDQIQLIDVREQAEFELQNLNGLLLPLSELEYNLDKIDSAKTIVVHCKSGSRSRKAIEILQRRFPETELYNLSGGLNVYLKI